MLPKVAISEYSLKVFAKISDMISALVIPIQKKGQPSAANGLVYNNCWLPGSEQS